MTSPKAFRCILFLVVFLMTAAIASAQGGPQIQFMKNGRPDPSAQLNFVSKAAGVKGTAIPGSSGTMSIPADILSSNKPHTHFNVEECTDDGTLYAVEDGAENQNPCKHHRRVGGFFLDDTGTQTFGEVPVTGSGGGAAANTAGGLPIWGMVDVEPGFTRWGAFPGAFASSCASESTLKCTHDETTFKFAVLGAILFGNGWLSAGPVFGYEHHNTLNSTLSGSSEGGPFVETEGIRDNTVLIGARESLGFGEQKRFRINFDEAEGLNTLHFRLVDTTGSGSSASTSIEEENSTLNAPVFGVSFLYFPSAHVGFSVGYRYSPLRLDRCINCDGDFEEELHDNDVVFDLTFVFGRPKD